LFTAASKQNALAKVETDLSTIGSIIAKDTKLATFLETPLVDRFLKQQGVTSMLAKGKYSPLISNFFSVLAENGRLDQTQKILGAFTQLMTASRGEVTVTVTSAKPLESKIVQQLKDSLTKSALIEKGSKVLVSNKVSFYFARK
jgi:F-type H+-transporting ATPase subunit O